MPHFQSFSVPQKELFCKVCLEKSAIYGFGGKQNISVG